MPERPQRYLMVMAAHGKIELDLSGSFRLWQADSLDELIDRLHAVYGMVPLTRMHAVQESLDRPYISLTPATDAQITDVQAHEVLTLLQHQQFIERYKFKFTGRSK